MSFVFYLDVENKEKRMMVEVLYNLSYFLVAKCNQPSNINDILATVTRPIDGILRIRKYVICIISYVLKLMALVLVLFGEFLCHSHFPGNMSLFLGSFKGLTETSTSMKAS